MICVRFKKSGKYLYTIIKLKQTFTNLQFIV